MKNTLTWILGLSMVLIGACKDDNPATPVKKFADYTRADIIAEETNITTIGIPFDSQSLQNFKSGSLIFFKSSSGNYGKIEIVEVDVNHNLVVNLIVFNSLGNAYINESYKVFALGSSYDLDDPDVPVVNSGNTADLYWGTSEGIYGVVFGNNAKAYLYKP